MKRGPRLAGLVAALLCAGPLRAAAHPLDPALLELRELKGGRVEVEWKVPAGTSALRPVLPPRCRESSGPTATESARSLVQEWDLSCGEQSLVGEEVGVRGLRERQTDALLRIRLLDGRVIQAVVRPDDPVFRIPERTAAASVGGSYLALGFEHILTGPDHLLFVLALVLLVRGRFRLLATITAFTLGHSVTLALAVLGLIRVPPAPVEALIAVSLVVVANELARESRAGGPTAVPVTFLGRRPWTMAAAFGLLHGLGFAGALVQVGLPPDDIPLALLSFNVGIELGQLVFVACVLVMLRAFVLVPTRVREVCRPLPAYAVGSLAAFWVFERVAALLPVPI